MAKNNLSQWSLALLRAVLGVIFVYHGYFKLFAPGGFKGTVGFFLAIGIPAAQYVALLVGALEFFGGILFLIGLLTRWVSVLFIIEFLVAFFKVHLKNGFAIGSSYGYEFVLLILAALAVVLFNGAGKLSAGKKFFKNKNLQ